MGRLILDTGVLIQMERGRLSLTDFGDDDDLAIAAVTIAEMKMGIELGDAARRPSRQQFLEELRKVIPIEDYTPEVADHHSELMVIARRQGRTRGPHDLIIAATARKTRRKLLTTDKSARFDDLPGVKTQLVQPELARSTTAEQCDTGLPCRSCVQLSPPTRQGRASGRALLGRFSGRNGL